MNRIKEFFGNLLDWKNISELIPNNFSGEKISNKGISENIDDLRFINNKKFLDKFLSKLEFLFNKYLIKENKSSSYKSFLKITTKILSIFQDKELKKKFKLYD